jgi:hypothetical protein
MVDVCYFQENDIFAVHFNCIYLFTYFGHLFHTIGCGAIAQPGQELFGTGIHERIGKARELWIFGRMILWIPQATHDAIILGHVAAQPKVFTVLERDKVVNFFWINQIILHHNVGL